MQSPVKPIEVPQQSDKPSLSVYVLSKRFKVCAQIHQSVRFSLILFKLFYQTKQGNPKFISTLTVR